MSESRSRKPSLFCFGLGYSALALARALQEEGWRITGTCRSEARREELGALGIEAWLFDRERPLADPAAAFAGSTYLLSSVPPDAAGDPVIDLCGPAIAARRDLVWAGYLSTTGVYGDRRGRWVTEESHLAAQSVEGGRRVGAERDWLEVGRGMGLTVTVFRLPGIYGPGRSPFQRLRDGTARRIIAPGQVFSRIHVEDIAGGLAASIARPRAGGIYNLCDDEPCPNGEVIAYAAGLLGRPAPPEVALADAGLSPAASRFYAESKRVSNARAKAELGWRPAYRSYREGLRATLEAENRGGLA